MKIDLVRIREIEAEIAAINNVDLGDLEIYDGEKRINPTEKTLQDWKFTGLSNFWFLKMECPIFETETN
jgi:hypothetical protein